MARKTQAEYRKEVARIGALKRYAEKKGLPYYDSPLEVGHTFSRGNPLGPGLIQPRGIKEKPATEKSTESSMEIDFRKVYGDIGIKEERKRLETENKNLREKSPLTKAGEKRQNEIYNRLKELNN